MTVLRDARCSFRLFLDRVELEQEYNREVQTINVKREAQVLKGDRINEFWEHFSKI